MTGLVAVLREVVESLELDQRLTHDHIESTVLSTVAGALESIADKLDEATP